MLKKLIIETEKNLIQQKELKDEIIDFLDELSEKIDITIDIEGEWVRFTEIKEGFIIDDKGQFNDYNDFSIVELYDIISLLSEYRYKKELEKFKK